MLEEEHRLLEEVIHRNFGLSFPTNRRELLRLRLEPRLRELKLRRFMDYYLLLECGGAPARKELWHLAHRVTNNETYFFREIEPITSLYRAAVTSFEPPVSLNGELRVLSAGCSSGEEAYTLALLAREHRCSLAGLDVQIDGFDVDSCRLRIAQHGVYGASSMRAVDASRRTYFEQVGDAHYRLRPELRPRVHFFEANIVRPDTYCRAVPYDVVFCRNVLIYFSEESIRRAVDCFARALRPGGLLFLGHSESIIGLHPAFETIRVGRAIAYRYQPARR